MARPVIHGMTWSAARPGRVLPIMIFKLSMVSSCCCGCPAWTRAPLGRMPAPGCDGAGLRPGLLCMCVVREKLWQ